MRDAVYIHLELAENTGGKPTSIWNTVNNPDTRIDVLAHAVDDGPVVVGPVVGSHKLLVGHDLNLTLMVLRERFGLEFEKIVDIACYLRFLGLNDSFDNARRLVGAEPPGSPAQIIGVIRSVATRLFADRLYMTRDFYIARRTAQENLHGLPVDKNLAEKLKQQMSAERTQLWQQIAREFPFVSTAHLNDGELVKNDCERHFGVPIPSLSRKDPDVALLRRTLPQLSAFLDLHYRYHRLVGGIRDLAKIVDGPDRIYFPLEFFGTHTGRFSSSGEQAGNVNVQGTPRGGSDGLEVFDEFRQIIRANPEESWVSSDLSSIEPRILAFLADQQNLLARFRAGDDPYIWFMAQVLPGVQIEKHGVNKHLRRLGKTAVNGLGYGEGYDKFRGDMLAEVPDADEEQIRAAYDGYRLLFPAIVQLRPRFMRMFRAAMSGDRAFPAGKCRFVRLTDLKETGASVAVELPTGRSLYYRSLTSMREYRFHNGQPKQSTILRYAPWLSLKPASSPKVPSQTRVELKETTVINNVVQAIARDIVVAQWQEIEKSHPELRVRFSNHDELVVATARCTCPNRDAHEASCPWIAGRRVVQDVMSRVPSCFPKLAGLPLACEMSDTVRDAWGK